MPHRPTGSGKVFAASRPSSVAARDRFSAPDLSAMDAAYTLAHIEEDREHWWFQGRLTVLHALLRRVLPSRRLRILELGCGTGNVLGTLGEFGELVGMEMNADLRAVAVASGLDVRAGTLPGETGVERGSADVVLM